MGDVDHDPHTPRSNGSIRSGDIRVHERASQLNSARTPGKKMMMNLPPKQIALKGHDILS